MTQKPAGTRWGQSGGKRFAPIKYRTFCNRLYSLTFAHVRAVQAGCKVRYLISVPVYSAHFLRSFTRARSATPMERRQGPTGPPGGAFLPDRGVSLLKADRSSLGKAADEILRADTGGSYTTGLNLSGPRSTRPTSEAPLSSKAKAKIVRKAIEKQQREHAVASVAALPTDKRRELNRLYRQQREAGDTVLSYADWIIRYGLSSLQ